MGFLSKPHREHSPQERAGNGGGTHSPPWRHLPPSLPLSEVGQSLALHSQRPPQLPGDDWSRPEAFKGGVFPPSGQTRAPPPSAEHHAPSADLAALLCFNWMLFTVSQFGYFHLKLRAPQLLIQTRNQRSPLPAFPAKQWFPVKVVCSCSSEYGGSGEGPRCAPAFAIFLLEGGAEGSPPPAAWEPPRPPPAPGAAVLPHLLSRGRREAALIETDGPLSAASAARSDSELSASQAGLCSPTRCL